MRDSKWIMIWILMLFPGAVASTFSVLLPFRLWKRFEAKISRIILILIPTSVLTGTILLAVAFFYIVLNDGTAVDWLESSWMRLAQFLILQIAILLILGILEFARIWIFRVRPG